MKATQNIRTLIASAAMVLGLGAASALQAAGPAVALDRFPEGKLTDVAALQNGAKVFMNYCLGCHGISQVRYNKLRDIGLTEDQIKSNLILTKAKFGDPILSTIPLKDSKEWFGKTPPDLSLTARSRSSGAGTGADWIYTYLRSYYLDPSRPTGWNNVAFPAVGMPHVLWELQGQNRAEFKKVSSHGQESEVFSRFVNEKPGSLSPAEYDNLVADLTAFLAWVADPVAQTRKQVGVWALIFLALFMVFAWRLNASFWRDVK